MNALDLQRNRDLLAWKGIVLWSGGDVLDLPEFGFRCALRDLHRGTPLA